MAERHTCAHSADVMRRLSRIEGQFKGIKEMVSDGRHCEELLTQLSAVSSAVTQVARVILTEHLEHCIAEGFANNDEEGVLQSLEQAVDLFSKLK